MLLCRAGDLYRYMNGLEEEHADLKSYYLDNAYRSYELASTVDPKFGLAYNQLGVVSISLGRTTDALYFYCKSYQCDETRQTAKQNIRGLLSHYHSKLSGSLLSLLNRLESMDASKHEAPDELQKDDISEREKYILLVLNEFE